MSRSPSLSVKRFVGLHWLILWVAVLVSNRFLLRFKRPELLSIIEGASPSTPRFFRPNPDLT